MEDLVKPVDWPLSPLTPVDFLCTLFQKQNNTTLLPFSKPDLRRVNTFNLSIALRYFQW